MFKFINIRPRTVICWQTMRTYRSICRNFCSNVYLLTKLRSGTLKLNIELGRYNNTPRESRLCLCCNMNVVENEYHFHSFNVVVTQIRVITKLPNFEQSSKWKVKTHKYINRQNQSTTLKLWKWYSFSTTFILQHKHKRDSLGVLL
jgi:hypothetical protein